MLAYLGYFSTSFIIAVIAWPFVSAALTLPILAGMYHRHHRLRFGAVLAAYLVVLYLLGLAAFTLYPMPDNPESYCAVHHVVPQLNPLRFIADIRTDGLYGLLQLVMNVVLFVPLGFALARWARWKAWAVVAAGFLVSLVIELSQLTGFWHLYPCAYRQFDVNDLMTNTLGAVLGLIVARLFSRVAPLEQIDRGTINTSPKLLHRAVTLAIDMFLIAVAYFSLGAGAVLLLHAAAAPLPNGDYRLLGLTFGVEVFTVITRVIAGLAFLVFELWIPATHRGQTLGGMFTHMTVETRRRSGNARIAFYALRSVVLYALIQPGFSSSFSEANRVSFAVAFVLIVFWLVKRQMPYDLIPGEAGSEPELKSESEPEQRL
ncbi:VanZ family protein [Bifidobacterium tibiigranuli]|jgi:glycopeptide antibiotics resistance protein|uniref:VanZ family protein n=1 Tax=Bifidobacterium tibiigranuli TaxID=2172043 RepID=UPI0023573698|nr:VanZ family protein [Bifidobacterium tibiigranuli]MCH3975706.1 VanZ family protein [Bifidobacterium tibiigranuli]MCH4189837.1 VanZ family protein [Bifidobacterium tibiigranuli]MCH4202991.1 VanZ family protein [Bifidobacterium tibiigranuli]MCH4275023.1 VanZ family protein [Bifidobacterium tibiigranuli]MCI1222343.1 VanZ family protein [Bifidobacterium tibiigranuli]